jgi:hypothetical protein
VDAEKAASKRDHVIAGKVNPLSLLLAHFIGAEEPWTGQVILICSRKSVKNILALSERRKRL